jgi:DNA-binding transcriptional regulator GbsR (MarR family)
MTEKEKYIENVGLFYEKYGLSKMAGRILGCLISSETDNN